MERLSDDQQDFVAQLTELQSALHNLCRILMPGRDEDVLDVVQEVNRVILEKAEHFEAGTNFKAWAYSIVRFQVLAYQKRIQRNRLQFDSELVETLANESHGDDFLSRQRILADCLAELSSEDQALLRTRYGQHGSMSTYAEKAGRTLSSLKRNLSRLRDQLRDCVNRKLGMDNNNV